MADGGRQDVLGQKARAAQRAHEARGMSTAKALRRALSRTAEELWALAMVCDGVQLELLDQDGVAESLSNDRLIVLLDGPGGAVGIAQADRGLMASVTEIQTIQTVTGLPVEDRPLTATDAAMLAPLLDGTLARLATNLDDNPLRPQLEGFRFGAMIEDRRSATLLLDAAEYRTFHIEVEVAQGKRRGALSIFLPDRVLPEAVPETVEPEPPRHEETMLGLPATLDAVLCRIRLPLSRAETLRPGDLLPLPVSAIDGVELVAQDGKAIAGGRLGQLNGARAVRLRWPRGEGGAPVAAAFDAAEEVGDAEDTPSTASALSAPNPAPMAMPAEAAKDGAAKDGAADAEDALPDLPPLDFGDFDSDADAEPLDFDFSAGAMDFDIETQD